MDSSDEQLLALLATDLKRNFERLLYLTFCSSAGMLR